MQTYPVYYPAATVTLTDFVRCQCLHLLDNSRFCHTWGGVSPFHEHPIIVTVESQRIAGNLTVFGIKNARRTTSQGKLSRSGRVDKLVASAPPVRLLQHNISFADNSIKLAGFSLSGWLLLIAGSEVNVDRVGGHRAV